MPLVLLIASRHIVAMIKGPKQSGNYPDRWIDCQRALEPLFNELVHANAAPYIDLSQMAGPIFQAAYDAGWTVDDVAKAVSELAVNHELGKAANRETDAAIARTRAARRTH